MWAMIAVSIAMAIWTFGLQMFERRANQKRIAAAEEDNTGHFEKQVVSETPKL